MKNIVPVVNYSFGEWIFFFPKEIYNVLEEFHTLSEYIGSDDLKAIDGLEKIVTKFQNSHIDGFNHLSMSYRNIGNYKESFFNATVAYLIGMNSFSDDFNHSKDKLNWGFIENRPFLRSLQILGLEFMYNGDLLRAEQLFKQLLIYNPNDNQGIRYLLTEIYYHLHDNKALKKLNKEYKNENLLEELLNSDEGLLLKIFNSK